MTLQTAGRVPGGSERWLESFDFSGSGSKGHCLGLKAQDLGFRAQGPRVQDFAAEIRQESLSSLEALLSVHLPTIFKNDF